MLTPHFDQTVGDSPFFRVNGGEQIELTFSVDTDNDGTYLDFDATYTPSAKLYLEGQEQTFFGTLSVVSGTPDKISFVATATETAAVTEGLYVLDVQCTEAADAGNVQHIAAISVRIVDREQTFDVPINADTVYNILSLTTSNLATEKVQRNMLRAAGMAKALIPLRAVEYFMQNGWSADAIAEVHQLAAHLVRFEIYDYADDRIKQDIKAAEDVLRAISVDIDQDGTPDVGVSSSLRKRRSTI